MEVRNCLVCDTEFELNKYSPNQKYCKSVCAQKGRKLGLSGTIKTQCIICGRGIVRKNAKFCSKDCYTEYQKTRKNPSNKEIEIECEYCGKLFWVKNYMKSKTKFCSMKCSKYGQSRPHTGMDNRIDKICEYCGDDYKVHKYRSKSSHYCSRECKHEVGRIEKKCKYCKIEFITTNHQDRSFCSLNCSQKYCGPSKIEDSVYDIFISEFGLKNIEIQHTIHGNDFWYCVDFLIYDKIIVEVFGDYWHCNPRIFEDKYYHKQCKKTASEIRNSDLIKIDNLKNSGYIVYTIWEDHDKPEVFNRNLNKIINEIRIYKKQKKN